MCVVVDADTFAYFTNPISSRHKEFQPVVKWVRSSNSKFVYGGKTYGDQLDKYKGFLDFLTRMWQEGKTHKLNHKEVDDIENALARTITGPDYNDHHIVALVLISRCKLVCSMDNGLKNLIDCCYSPSGRATIKRQLRIRKLRKPSIYSGTGSVATIRSRTFSDNCGPCSHT